MDTAAPSVSPLPSSSTPWHERALKAAWWAVILGLAIQAILLLVLLAGFDIPPDWRKTGGDIAQKISWGTIVCVGLALGSAASKLRGAAMGLIGLLGAPLAFTTARTVQKSVNKALDVASSASDVSPVLIALLKGLQYACLGLALAWLARRATAGWRGYAGVGAVHGTAFGGSILLAMIAAQPAMPVALRVTTGLNELLFPTGCALVIYATTRLGSAQKIADRI